MDYPSLIALWEERRVDASRSVPRVLPGVEFAPADFGLPGEGKRFFIAILPGGEYLRLTERAYDIVQFLQSAQGNCTYGEAAAALSQRWGIQVRPDKLCRLVVTTIAAYGLLVDIPASLWYADRWITWHAASDAHIPHPTIVDPRRPSVLTFRIPLIPRRVVGAITPTLTWLYHPLFAILLGLAGIVSVLYVSIAVLPGATGVARPVTIAEAYLWALLSVIWHEFGHATACRRFKVPTGAIGFGLYFIYPAFYTDVTGVWRLPRRQRAVVDLGGIYFQSMVLLLLLGLYLWRDDTSFLLAAVITAGMVTFALNPFLRFDGYWMLSDLLGLVALDRLEGAFNHILIQALKRRSSNPAYVLKGLETDISTLIPSSTPKWLRALLLTYMTTAPLFWIWFIVSLGRWGAHMFVSYPHIVVHFTTLVLQQHWADALPLISSLTLPWFIVFGVAMTVLRTFRRGRRAFARDARENLTEDPQRHW